MLDFLKKHTKSKENTATPQVPAPKQKYDFVEQYTLTSPKKLMVSYDYWSLCNDVPVRYENAKPDEGFAKCVELPSVVFFPWWETIQKAPQEVLNNPKFRTISVVNLEHGGRFFILPNVKDITRPIYAYPEGKLGLLTTPEINRAIVEQIKMFTR